MKFLMRMHNARREELTAKLKWEARGVSLDRATCGVVKANDDTPRTNPDHGVENIEKYLEIKWSGERIDE